MPVATIVALLEAVTTFVADMPEIVAALKTAAGLVQSGQAPTAAEQAQLDAGLAAAHAALQAS